MRRIALALLILPLLGGSPHAEPPATTVVGVVTLPLVAETPRARLVAEFERLVPVYAQTPGLIRKYFVIGEGTVGGIYVWTNRAAAEAFYNGPWRASARARVGIDPTVMVFDAPVQLEGVNVAAARP